MDSLKGRAVVLRRNPTVTKKMEKIHIQPTTVLKLSQAIEDFKAEIA